MSSRRSIPAVLTCLALALASTSSAQASPGATTSEPSPTSGELPAAPEPAPEPAPAPAPVAPTAQPEAQGQAQQPPAPVYTPEATAAPAQQPAKPARPGLGMAVGGFGMFGVSYVIAAVIGGIDEWLFSGDFLVMAIPVAGPFIAIPRANSTFGAGVIALDGVAQVVGLGLGIAGAVRLSRSRSGATLGAGPGGLTLRF